MRKAFRDDAKTFRGVREAFRDDAKAFRGVREGRDQFSGHEKSASTAGGKSPQAEEALTQTDKLFYYESRRIPGHRH